MKQRFEILEEMIETEYNFYQKNLLKISSIKNTNSKQI